mmetsp:Transcript_21230/g.18846  ORF Transcript_21230/g.18846 Transcript_21230/m.18846 type:complete len:238 (+) Transcript_21230:13-726(+)
MIKIKSENLSIKNINPNQQFFELEEDEIIKDEQMNPKPSTQASPRIWIPLSLLIAIIYAVGNVSSSVIAKYKLRARALQSIGTIIGNITPLLIISFKDNKTKNSPKLKWFYNIYFHREVNTEGEILENKWTNKIYWERVRGSSIVIFNGVFVLYFFFLSYNWANIAGLNNGVLMSLYALKPILISIMFYFAFGQTLKRAEVVGIGLCVVCALLIGLSAESHEVNLVGESSRTYIIWA